MTKKNKPPFKIFPVIARVKSVYGLQGEDIGGKAPCKFYKPGDKLIFNEEEIVGKICYVALECMMHAILPMRVGLDYPWVKEGIAEIACPDAARPVVFELFRDENNSNTDKQLTRIAGNDFLIPIVNEKLGGWITRLESIEPKDHYRLTSLKAATGSIGFTKGVGGIGIFVRW